MTTESFEEWAFGTGPFPDSSLDRMKAWNQRHSDKLLLHPNDSIHESLIKMRLIYDPIYQERTAKTHQKIPQRIGALGRQALVRLLCAWLAVVAWPKVIWARIDVLCRRF